jgi:alpha-beta hydrolase superfamily lysophospholipase
MVGLVRGSELIIEKAGTDKSFKELHILPGLKHDVFHERQPDGNNAIKLVVDFIDRMYASNKPAEEVVRK